jgi:hypothetical protein
VAIGILLNKGEAFKLSHLLVERALGFQRPDWSNLLSNYLLIIQKPLLHAKVCMTAFETYFCDFDPMLDLTQSPCRCFASGYGNPEVV